MTANNSKQPFTTVQQWTGGVKNSQSSPAFKSRTLFSKWPTRCLWEPTVGRKYSSTLACDPQQLVFSCMPALILKPSSPVLMLQEFVYKNTGSPTNIDIAVKAKFICSLCGEQAFWFPKALLIMDTQAA